MNGYSSVKSAILLTWYDSEVEFLMATLCYGSLTFQKICTLCLLIYFVRHIKPGMFHCFDSHLKERQAQPVGNTYFVFCLGPIESDCL